MVSVCDVVEWIWCSGKCVVFRAVQCAGRGRLAGQKVGRWFLLFGVVGGDGDAQRRFVRARVLVKRMCDAMEALND